MEPHDYILEMMEIGNSLQAAVFDGDIDLAINLLENGKFDLNKLDQQGRTLLHYTGCRGQYDMIELLLEKGADPNIKDKNGNTPLHWCGHVDIVELLISYGARVAERNCLGATPKDMALRRGVDKTMIKVFEQYEKKDNTGKTQGVKTLLHEFSDEMGVKNFILLILGLLFISVYVAFIITGFSSHLNRIPPIVLH